MTREEAEELLKIAIITLNNETEKNNLPATIADEFLTNCLQIDADNYSERQFMTINGTSRSFKLSNISIDLKRAIEIAIELMLSSTIPNGSLAAVQMILLVIFKIAQLSEKKIDRDEAEVVIALHQLNAYKNSVSTEKLCSYMVQGDLNDSQKDMNKINEILDALSDYRIIDITEDKIQLKEKVLYMR